MIINGDNSLIQTKKKYKDILFKSTSQAKKRFFLDTLNLLDPCKREKNALSIEGGKIFFQNT